MLLTPGRTADGQTLGPNIHWRDRERGAVVSKFSEVTWSPNERATDNIKMRVKPSDKQRISRAAELAGVKLSTFVRASAAREAERILRDHRTTTLSERDRRTVLEALDNPSPPTPVALAAVRDYRSRIANAR